MMQILATVTAGRYEGDPISGVLSDTFGTLSPDRIRAGLGEHTGLDIDDLLNPGGEVTAPAPGRIIASHFDTQAGWIVLIDHTNGYQSHIYHLARQSPIAVGDWVRRGQVIGQEGNTGSAVIIGPGGDGNHVHFGLKKDGVYVDPLDYIVAELTEPEIEEPAPVFDPEAKPNYIQSMWAAFEASFSTTTAAGAKQLAPVVNDDGSVDWTVRVWKPHLIPYDVYGNVYEPAP